MEIRLPKKHGLEQLVLGDISCGGENHEHNNECRATEVVGKDWSSEVVALFLEDWKLGRVALSCHMAMDFLCQEMRDAWVSSESLGSSLSLCSQRQCCSFAEPSQQHKPFSHRGPAVTSKEKDVKGEGM